MRCSDLNNDTFTILGTHFSYNRKLIEKKTFYTTVSNIQRVLRIWKMKNLTPERNIVTFKTLAMSKIAFQSLITTVPRHIVNGPKNIQVFLWKFLLRR